MLAGGALSEGATTPEEPSASGPFLVASKDGRNGSRWLIRGVTPIEVKVSGKDVGGRFATILVNTPPGRGPELHVHLRQNELFYVVAGRIGLQCGTPDRNRLETINNENGLKIVGAPLATSVFGF